MHRMNTFWRIVLVITIVVVVPSVYFFMTALNETVIVSPRIISLGNRDPLKESFAKFSFDIINTSSQDVPFRVRSDCKCMAYDDSNSSGILAPKETRQVSMKLEIRGTTTENINRQIVVFYGDESKEYAHVSVKAKRLGILDTDEFHVLPTELIFVDFDGAKDPEGKRIVVFGRVNEDLEVEQIEIQPPVIRIDDGRTSPSICEYENMAIKRYKREQRKILYYSVTPLANIPVGETTGTIRITTNQGTGVSEFLLAKAPSFEIAPSKISFPIDEKDTNRTVVISARTEKSIEKCDVTYPQDIFEIDVLYQSEQRLVYEVSRKKDIPISQSIQFDVFFEDSGQETLNVSCFTSNY